MNKTELIDAIQQVITPNGQKGITAESLANLLIEMVNATPEGGSSSVSGGVVFYAGLPTEEVSEITGYNKMSLTPEQRQHNAEMFAVVKNANPAIVWNLDLSEAYQAEEGGELGVDLSGLKCCVSGYIGTYFPKDLAELAYGIDQDVITSIGMMEYFIFADGSVEVNFS